jgi:hypothetical protein
LLSTSLLLLSLLQLRFAFLFSLLCLLPTLPFLLSLLL